MRQLGFWGTLDETQKRHPLRTIAEDWQRHLSKTVFKHATLEIRSFVWGAEGFRGPSNLSGCRSETCQLRIYMYDISMNPILPFFSKACATMGASAPDTTLAPVDTLVRRWK